MVLSPKLKWKINRYGQTLEERLEKAGGFLKGLMCRQNVCPACRAFVDRKEKICPFCSERTSAVPRRGAGRLLAYVLPLQTRYATLLMGANVALFGLAAAAIIERTTGGVNASTIFESIDSYALVRFGAKYGPLVSGGEWWRLLTPIFLHLSLLQLAINTFVLFDLGPAMEQLYGSHKFLVLYVISGAAGFFLSYLWHPYSVSAGASGALFGLMGTMIAYGYRNRTSLLDSGNSMYLRMAVYGLIFSFLMPGRDNAAHIGGLIAGLLFGAVVSDMPSVTKESIYFWRTLRTLIAILVMVGFVMVGLRQRT